MMRIVEGIILAAGESRRLMAHIRFPKPLLKLSKMRLIQFPVFSLLLNGVEKFIIVTRQDLKEEIPSIVCINEDIKYKVVVNREIHRENGYSLYLGLKNVDSEFFFVSMADHIYPPEVPARLLKCMGSDIDILVAADSDPIYISIDEATKIKTSDGHVVSIGKGIKDFDHVDAGVFIMKRSILDVTEELVAKKEVVGVSDIINYAIEKGYNVQIASITNSPWLDIDTLEDVEKLLRGDASKLFRALLNKYDQLIRD